MVHDSLYCLFLQVGVGVYCDKMRGVNHRQTIIQCMSLSRLVTVNIFDGTVCKSRRLHVHDLLFGMIIGSIINNNQPNTSGVLLI